jgi:hypothetical protein
MLELLKEGTERRARLSGGHEVSYSIKAVLRTTAFAALVVVLALGGLLGVVGCGGDSTPPTARTVTTVEGTGPTTTGFSADAGALVGKWYCERLKETIEFTSDGKMIWTKSGKDPVTFTFTVQAAMIVFQQPNAPDDNSLAYTLSGDTLTVMDTKYGRLTYTKQ